MEEEKEKTDVKSAGLLSNHEKGENDVVEATSENAKNIKAIDRTTVHQICSGQVVLNLATAVKELVENSVDAGATQVEVKLKDHGASLIEVTDNGSGVEEGNFQGLTLKHHTSKLREFQDLVGVETFGFRGEALSSLCALSSVNISTRHISSQHGSNIAYDHNGKILKIEKTARPVGTTVILKDIFSTMPVRVKEFQRNIKKEFAKLCQVLNSYCLVSTGIRIQCINTVKGKRTVVLSTKGDDSVKDNILSIFGSKQASTLREIQQEALSLEELSDLGIKSGVPPDVTLTGYISSCNYGDGRGAADRQYFYINSRPCDPSKISKLINEVYHHYNRTQYPFVYLNILTQRTTVDVNITPDKRQVFLQNERYLCGLIKKSLDTMYKDTPRDILINIQEPLKNLSEEVKSESTKINLSSLKRKFSSEGVKNQEENSSRQVKKQPKMDSFFTKLPAKESENCDKENIKTVDASGDTAEEGLDQENENHIHQEQNELTNNDSVNEEKEDNDTIENDYISQASSQNSNFKIHFEGSHSPGDLNSESERIKQKGVEIVFDDMQSLSQMQNKSQVENILSQRTNINFDDMKSLSQPVSKSISSQGAAIIFDDFQSLSQPLDFKDQNTKEKSTAIIFDDFQSLSQRISPVKETETKIIFDDFQCQSKSLKSNYKKNGNNDTTAKGIKICFDDIETLSQARVYEEESTDVIKESNNVIANENKEIAKSDSGKDNDINLDDTCKPERRKEVSLSFSMDVLKDSIEKIKKVEEKKEAELKFSAKINPQDNKNAEKELMRQISKSDFSNMKIFGQFNLGFIIAGLDRDIFIIDQHATDEKYNFERLQQTTVINSQLMVTPQPLELTAVNENILMDNLDVFLKNGFKFQIDEDAAATQRVKLSHLPISKNWSFGKQDIDELIFMLAESAEGSVLRPSRVRAMFASRACRSSVMIGKSLAKGEMRRLVDHMGQIEQPWNCPHGRPTIRHLVNTTLLD